MIYRLLDIVGFVIDHKWITAGLLTGVGSLMGDIAPVNVIIFKTNYSHFFRDVEKIEYVLNVCQFRWRESNYFVINHSWK